MIISPKSIHERVSRMAAEMLKRRFKWTIEERVFLFNTSLGDYTTPILPATSRLRRLSEAVFFLQHKQYSGAEACYNDFTRNPEIFYSK